MKLKWVTLPVSNLEKSLEFYTGILGMDIAVRMGNEHHQIVMLGKPEEAKVELIFDPHKEIDQTKDGISFGLQTKTLAPILETLRARGFTLIGPISPNPTIKFFFVHDPDGYTIQLIEEQL